MRVEAINLTCASDLPGAELLDVAACLATLDGWATAVDRYANDSSPIFRRKPAAYGNDEGIFRFLAMVTLLKHPLRGIGVRYQPRAIGSYDFRDSRDDFLHGVLTRRLGTCLSLPVLFVSIG